MKKLLFCLLLAASQPLFAQNIDLAEIESLLSRASTDSIDNFLSIKGFQRVKIQGGAPVKGLQAKEGWRYSVESGPEARSVTILGRFVDTSGKSFYRLQTSNPFFYSHLMNQLTQNNYSYKGTIPTEKETNLVFGNSQNEVIIRIISELQLPNYYQFNIGPAISNIGFFAPHKPYVKRATVKPKAKKSPAY